MIVEKEFISGKDSCKATTHVEIAPFNQNETIVITVLNDGKKLDSLKIKGNVEKSSLDGVEWFFSKYGLGCYMIVRNWWMNEAYPKIQIANIQRNRTTTPSERQNYRHGFRYN